LGVQSDRSLYLDAHHLSDDEALARVEICEGTYQVESLSSLNDSYEHGAFVAKPPWLRLHPKALSVANLRIGRALICNTIGICPISDASLGFLRTIRESYPRVGTFAFSDEVWSEIFELVRADLSKTASWDFATFVRQGSVYKISPGGNSNTTISEVTGKRVGLHLDCWDNLPAAGRFQGSNRISINLGFGTRFLQILPLPAIELRERILARDAMAVEPVPNELSRALLTAFPDLPILRIAILPGEAYIAPTENFIHDGSVKAFNEDVTITLRGSLSPV
jgi:hypothetical protein